MPKTEDNKFACVVCEQAFSRKFSYKRHCTKMHPEENVENAENSQKTDNKNVIMCHMCDKTFSRKYTLDRHLQNQHQVIVSQKPEIGEKNEEMVCPVCVKTYSCVSARNRHAKQAHDLQMSNNNTTYICPECGERYMNAKVINSHLKEEHNIDLDVVEIKFTSIEEFNSWKTKMENDEKSSYIASRGKKNVSQGTRVHFRCHRSGAMRKKETTERTSLKPSIKTGAYCPSRIKITELSTGQVEATFIKNHVGHTTGPQYLRRNRRSMSASRIAAHVPLKQIKDVDVDSEGKPVAECSTNVNPSDNVSLSTQFHALLDIIRSYELKHPHLLPEFIKLANVFIKDLDKIIESDQSETTAAQEKMLHT